MQYKIIVNQLCNALTKKVPTDVLGIILSFAVNPFTDCVRYDITNNQLIPIILRSDYRYKILDNMFDERNEYAFSMEWVNCRGRSRTYRIGCRVPIKSKMIFPCHETYLIENLDDIYENGRRNIKKYFHIEQIFNINQPSKFNLVRSYLSKYH